MQGTGYRLAALLLSTVGMVVAKIDQSCRRLLSVKTFQIFHKQKEVRV